VTAELLVCTVLFKLRIKFYFVGNIPKKLNLLYFLELYHSLLSDVVFITLHHCIMFVVYGIALFCVCAYCLLYELLPCCSLLCSWVGLMTTTRNVEILLDLN